MPDEIENWHVEAPLCSPIIYVCHQRTHKQIQFDLNKFKHISITHAKHMSSLIPTPKKLVKVQATNSNDLCILAGAFRILANLSIFLYFVI